MTKIYEIELDLGVIGEFTCDVHCLIHSNGDLGTVLKVYVPLGTAQANVLEFLSDEAIAEILVKCLHSETEGSLEWRDLGR